MEDNVIDENKKTILIVDDEKPIVDILVYNLQKEGYNTIEANDGEEAIKIAFEQKPDLILLDIMLPKVDGLTVCKRIRNSFNMPIIMISAKDEEIDKILGLELGADDYITKPFSVRELVARVKANLRKAEVSVKVEEPEIEEKKETKKEDKKQKNGNVRRKRQKGRVKKRPTARARRTFFACMRNCAKPPCASKAWRRQKTIERRIIMRKVRKKWTRIWQN